MQLLINQLCAYVVVHSLKLCECQGMLHQIWFFNGETLWDAPFYKIISYFTIFDQLLLTYDNMLYYKKH